MSTTEDFLALDENISPAWSLHFKSMQGKYSSLTNKTVSTYLCSCQRFLCYFR